MALDAAAVREAAARAAADGDDGPRGALVGFTGTGGTGATTLAALTGSRWGARLPWRCRAGADFHVGNEPDCAAPAHAYIRTRAWMQPGRGVECDTRTPRSRQDADGLPGTGPHS